MRKIATNSIRHFEQHLTPLGRKNENWNAKTVKANKNCFRSSKHKVIMAKWKHLFDSQYSIAAAHINGQFRWENSFWVALYAIRKNPVCRHKKIYLTRKKVLTPNGDWPHHETPQTTIQYPKPKDLCSDLVNHMTIHYDNSYTWFAHKISASPKIIVLIYLNLLFYACGLSFILILTKVELHNLLFFSVLLYYNFLNFIQPGSK